MDNKLTNGNLELISNEEPYWEFIRQIRNHPEIKDGFIKQDIISSADHKKYMQKYSSYFYLCLYKNSLAGYVGCIENDIRVATHPDFQGKGVAKFMITEIMKKHPEAIAKIKVKNEASLRLFQSCGFIKKYYILELE